ncbi:unnamed protein product [Rhizophagus irregularis]|nr:unnamed protein product [Rhizophagus irregularis]
MDNSNQNLDTTEISSKTHVKNLWKEANNNDYQEHATIFSDDSTQIINSASLNVDSTDTFMQALDNKIKSDKDDEIVKSWLFEQLETTINDSSEKALGGFGKIYSADWPEGHINYWDIENQIWKLCPNVKVALKSLDDSSNLNNDFLNEIKYYISGHFYCIQTVICYEPVNSTDSLSGKFIKTPANPISECFDCELDESDLNQDNDE